jgi:hypothetical protein
MGLSPNPCELLDIHHSNEYFELSQQPSQDVGTLLAQAELCRLVTPWPDPLEFDLYQRYMCQVSSGAQQWLNTKQYIQER